VLAELPEADLARLESGAARSGSLVVAVARGAQRALAHLLGHSTVALTLNTCSHVTPGLSGEAARTMDRLLGSGVSNAS
jgi:hypothetical protein